MSVTDRAARQVLLALLGTIREGQVTVVEGDRARRFGDGRPNTLSSRRIEAEITIHDSRVWGRVLREGSTGLGLAYADGWWDSGELTSLLRLLSRNLSRTDAVLQPLGRLSAFAGDPVRRRRSPERARDRRNIRAHYDIGDEVFALFLDETWMYSAAIFDNPQATLAEAQEAKLERICAQLQLGPRDHLLEIGTGWGGLAVYAARRHGCRVTTTTISERQFAHASRWVRESGLGDRVTVLREHYRDLRGRYDHLASIEMIEAVDWREYDDFFAACGTLLNPGGRMMLQAITIPDQRFARAKNRRDFIKNLIFPGGCLPSTDAILRSTARVTDLKLTNAHDIGLYYAETLRRWRTRLLERAGELPALGLDDRFARTFDFYFSYCEAGFDERAISDVQLTFERPRARAVRSVRHTDRPSRVAECNVAATV